MTTLIRGGLVHDAVHRDACKADILLADGKIAAIGTDLTAPADAVVFDADGLDVFPGFVDAHTHIGLDGYGIGYEGCDYNEMNDIWTPQLRAIDGINPCDPSLADARKAGVTCVCTGPGSANVLGGTFLAMKTVGERVDAAFYLQINEFRGSRSLQLQLVDLRSAHDPGAREAEQLELCRTLIRGGGVSAKEAAKLLPSREQFVRVWRALEREVDGTLTSPELPFLRRLSAEALGAESFPRTVMCLAVFAERGLVTVERHDKYITLRLTGGKRVDLDASPYLCALREGLDGTKGGSSA